jgi:hypothetical protein
MSKRKKRRKKRRALKITPPARDFSEKKEEEEKTRPRSSFGHPFFPYHCYIFCFFSYAG